MTGRPRSDAARRKILDAALDLAARDGYTAVTIKGIAEAAGVGRQTVYRWWPSRGAVLLEALVDFGEPAINPEPTGDPRADLRAFLDATFTVVATPPVGNVLLGLTADAVSDPDIRDRLRDHVARRRSALRSRVAACGDWTVPQDTVVDLIYGTMWYRLISAHAPLGPELTDTLTPVLASLTAPSAP